MINGWECEMGIRIGIAVPGKMLGSCQDPFTLNAIYKILAEFAYNIRIGRERTNINYRIFRVIVYVQNRCEYLMYSQCICFSCRYFSLQISIRSFTRSRYTHGRCKARGTGNPHSSPEFHILSNPKRNFRDSLQLIC